MNDRVGIKCTELFYKGALTSQKSSHIKAASSSKYSHTGIYFYLYNKTLNSHYVLIPYKEELCLQSVHYSTFIKRPEDYNCKTAKILRKIIELDYPCNMHIYQYML